MSLNKIRLKILRQALKDKGFIKDSIDNASLKGLENILIDIDWLDYDPIKEAEKIIKES